MKDHHDCLNNVEIKEEVIGQADTEKSVEPTRFMKNRFAERGQEVKEEGHTHHE